MLFRSKEDYSDIVRKAAVTHESNSITNNYDILDNEYYIDISEENYLWENIRNAYTHAIEYMNNSECILNDFDVSDDQNFRETLSMKVSDGHAFYKLSEQYILSMYGSLISANKSDKIHISLYKERVQNTFIQQPTILVRYDVIKKKYTISNFVKYRLL